MKIREFTAKTTEEAIDAGLAELGVTLSDVRVDVLQEGAKGLFGLFGSKPARVRLTVMEDEKEDDQGLSDLLGSFTITEPAPRKKSAPKQERKSAPEGEKSAKDKENDKESDKEKPAKKPPPSSIPNSAGRKTKSSTHSAKITTAFRRCARWCPTRAGRR